MEKVDFFTPLSFAECKRDSNRLNWKERLLEKADQTFYWGGKVAWVIPRESEGSSRAVVLKAGGRLSCLQAA